MNNGYKHNKNVEIEYLQDLIDKFGNQTLQASQAIKIIYARYDELKKQRSRILAKTKSNSDEKVY